MSRPLRRAACAALACALLASVAPARPLVQVQNSRSVGVKSVGETMFGEVQGRTWFFKRDAPSIVLRHGNYEGEALAARILTRLGFHVPQSRLVTIEGQEGAFFQTELIDPAFTGDARIETLHDLREPIARLDPREVWLLTLADMAMGNGDRHRKNLLVGHTQAGRLRVLPIDQNLSFASPAVTVNFFNTHFVEGFRGVPAQAAAGPRFAHLDGRRRAKDAGRASWFLRRNQASAAAFDEDAAAASPDFLEAVVASGEFLISRLDDAFLDRLLTELPDEDITLGDPAARKADIRRVFRIRRDGLRREIRRVLTVRTAAQRQAKKVWEAGVEPRLRQRLRLSEKDERYVLAALTPDEDRVFPLVRTYMALLTAGRDTLAARQAVLRLADFLRSKGVPVELDLADLLAAERTADRSVFVEARTNFGDHRHVRTRYDHLHRDLAAGRPAGSRRCFLLVPAEGARRQLTSARDVPLPADEARRLAPVVAALDAALEPRVGDRVLFELDVFASDDAARVYRVGVRGSEGGYRFTGRVRVPHDATPQDQGQSAAPAARTRRPASS